ncbi:endonuclease [Acinetobacter phage vB_Ab4_Hep4-M]|uniref:Endonuclease n=1 Tax=Acinetobacter phage vB_Ab4_Hep4 TaxID=2970326 RepID=A0A976SPJ4_9CAUD|nr:endonuclease [Acinetobacter phage vB_Ab4_Hep4]WIS40031.1 endonuclease [Acinetobacter phage vB_Ab4_Hep4-M]
MTARKISRGQLRPIAMKLYKEQGEKCLLCHKPIDFTKMGRDSDYAVDHDHVTGLIRGTLHRSCNAGEGKVINAVGSWGSKSKEHAAIREWLHNLLNYYAYCDAHPTTMIYPSHKTADEKKEAQRVKRNAAARKARAVVKQRKQKGE